MKMNARSRLRIAQHEAGRDGCKRAFSSAYKAYRAAGYGIDDALENALHDGCNAQTGHRALARMRRR